MATAYFQINIWFFNNLKVNGILFGAVNLKSFKSVLYELLEKEHSIQFKAQEHEVHAFATPAWPLPMGAEAWVLGASASKPAASLRSYLPSAPIRYELEPPWSHVTSIQPCTDRQTALATLMSKCTSHLH